uniref:Uncharacterized protein n=1 Tax=Vespula pensylvanica TaxID=30213 RepID=A0A834NQC0_VESPE|nr:hypothetical protein H0235_012130 [Vespula pensylvanica]
MRLSKVVIAVWDEEVSLEEGRRKPKILWFPFREHPKIPDMQLRWDSLPMEFPRECSGTSPNKRSSRLVLNDVIQVALKKITLNNGEQGGGSSAIINSSTPKIKTDMSKKEKEGRKI